MNSGPIVRIVRRDQRRTQSQPRRKRLRQARRTPARRHPPMVSSANLNRRFHRRPMCLRAKKCSDSRRTMEAAPRKRRMTLSRKRRHRTTAWKAAQRASKLHPCSSTRKIVLPGAAQRRFARRSCSGPRRKRRQAPRRFHGIRPKRTRPVGQAPRSELATRGRALWPRDKRASAGTGSCPR